MEKCDLNKVIEVAKNYVGYLEKKSNSQLDSFTANAGSNNYTMFNRDYLPIGDPGGTINMQWCAAFVSMCFVYAYGLAAARALLCGGLHHYTPTGAGRFKSAGRYIKRGAGRPQAGDVVYFYSSAKGRIGHVGIVHKVSGSTVYTIEGNTSGANTLITNGGGVRLKSYSLSSAYIDGYGRPDYAGVESSTGGVIAPELGDRLLVNGCVGDDVRDLQEALLKLGCDLGRWGADGEFGDCTELAVTDFQRAHDLDADGEYGPLTHAALVNALADLGAGTATTTEARTVLISGGNCYVRSTPGTAGDKLGVAHAGDVLGYAGQTSDEGWLMAEYKGATGWVSGKYAQLWGDGGDHACA